MYDESMPSDQSDDLGQGRSNEIDQDELHMRRTTSLLRLLKTTDEPSLESEDVKREFLQLTALLRKIDKLTGNELLGPEEQQSDAGSSSSDAPGPRRIEVRGSGDASESSSVDSDESGGNAFEGDTASWQNTEHAHETGLGSSPESAQQFEESDESGESELRASGEASGTTDSGATDDNLYRWWVVFSGNVSLERLGKLRLRLSDSPFTIESRFEEIADGLIVLRLTTDTRMTMEQVEWIVLELMDSVGLDRSSAILSPQQ